MDKIKELIENFRNSSVYEVYGKQLKKVAVLLIIVVVTFGAIAFQNRGDGTEAVLKSNEEINTAKVEKNTDIYVDIGGQVKKPMLAVLKEGSRVEDAISAAGGLTAEADLTSINRADFLTDGQKIYIPSNEEMKLSTGGAYGSATGAYGADQKGVQTAGRININTADSAALQTLNGVGPATAEKIIDYRNTSGRFNKIEDLKNVAGIGDKTFEKLEAYITV